jgi:hypothetical protein
MVAYLFGPTNPPSLRFAGSSEFTPLPPLHFTTGDETEAERQVFVEAGPDRRVRRMLIVQFDRVRPGGEHLFEVPQGPERRFGGHSYRSFALAYDDVASATGWPDSAEGRTRALLIARGFRPPRVWKFARLARVDDPRARGEVNIYYMESGDRDFPEGLPGGSQELPRREAKRLLHRLRRSIMPLD